MVPLRQLAEEAVGNLVSFDTRLWRTLGPFLLRPGFLVKEYLAGRRKRYLPPLRLYIFVSFAFFLLMSLVGYGSDFREGFEGGFAGARDDLPADTSVVPPHATTNASTDGATLDTSASSPAASGGSVAPDDRTMQIWSQRTPVIFFLAVPLLGLVFKLLYWRSGLYYAQHLVVALHVQAFGFAAFASAITLEELLEAFADSVPEAVWAVLLLGSPAIYLLLTVRRVHGQPWWKTALKTVLVLVCYLPVTLAAAFLVAGAVNLLFG